MLNIRVTIGTNNSTSRNVCLCIARYIYKNSPRSVVYKVLQQLNGKIDHFFFGKIDHDTIIGQNTKKQGD